MMRHPACVETRRSGARHLKARTGIALVALSIFAIVCLQACQKKTPTLNLLVWEGYADPSFVHDFEVKNNCKVSASYMGSSDELVAKLKDMGVVS